MNVVPLHLGKARTLFLALIFAMCAVLVVSVKPLSAADDATNSCVNDESNPGIQLICEGQVQYILIDAARSDITFDVAMPLGTDRQGGYGECRDVNDIVAGNPGCRSSEGPGYPISNVAEYAARFPNAVIAINGDVFGSIANAAYAAHGPEGLTIVNGLRIDGDAIDHGTVGDSDGEAYRRPSMVIRGDGTDITIEKRSLLGIQMLSDSLNKSTPLMEAMSGCPLLLSDGNQLVTQNNYQSVVAEQNCTSIRGDEVNTARTAVGITYDGKMLILVAPRSENLMIWDVAARMRARNVKNAIGLDGGGSTQLWYARRSNPGSTIVQGGRRVANALVISHSLWRVPGQCTNLGAIQSAATQDNPCIPYDNTPPSATSFDVSINGGYASISLGGVSDSGGSGVASVNFSAKWNGTWHGIGSDSTAPYTLDWNMCAAGVPDGTVEFGAEVMDGSGNKYVWSQHYGNPLRNKSFNCDPNTGSGSGYIKIYELANYSGRVIWAQNNVFSNEPNAEGYSLEIPGGWSAKVWSDDNRSGEMRCFSSSVANLQDHGWNSRIQSIEGFTSNVCGDAQTGVAGMCADGYGCWQFSPGYFPLPTWDMNDILTEIVALPSNMSISLFRDGNRTGSYECENTTRVLPPEFNRQVTDVYVHMGRNCPPEQHQALLFYDGVNFGGYSWAGGTKPGSYNIDQFGARERVNDKAYSLRIPNGKSAWFYADANRGGEDSGCWTGDHSDLGNWKNKISSFELFDNTSCAPEMPTGLSGAPLDDQSIQLWWSHPNATDYGYVVYRWNGYDFAYLAETGAGHTSYIDTDVLCGADYFYKVSTRGRQESSAVGWIQVTTLGCPLPGEPVLPEEYVSSVRLSEEEEVLQFSWQPARNAFEYEARIDGTSFTSGRITGTSWTVRNLPLGMYRFTVTAFNRSGASQSSSYPLVVVVAKPALINVQPLGCDSAGLYWRNNSQYAVNFVVHRGDAEIGRVEYIPGTEYYSFVDHGLTPTGQYKYSVDTLPTNYMYGNWSNDMSVTIPSCETTPQPPQAPQLVSPFENQVFEKWDTVTFSWNGSSPQYETYLQSGSMSYYMPLDSTSWSDASLPTGSYEWYVRAINGSLYTDSVKGHFVIKDKVVVPPSQKLYLPLMKR